MTPLDAAFDAMQAAPDDEALRRAYFDRLAVVEVFLLLASEPKGDRVDPRLFDLEEGQIVLAFDSEARLTDMAGEAFYAGMPGSDLIAMAAQHKLGLGINLGSGAGEFLLQAEEVDWLATRLGAEVSEMSAAIRAWRSPRASEALIAAFDARLAASAGVLSRAVLAEAVYLEGGSKLAMALIDAAPDKVALLSQTLGQAVALIEPELELDLLTMAADDPRLEALERVGLRFDVPAPKETAIIPGAAPGMDPGKPPKLR